jgi:hypothetical protein
MDTRFSQGDTLSRLSSADKVHSNSSRFNEILVLLLDRDISLYLGIMKMKFICVCTPLLKITSMFVSFATLSFSYLFLFSISYK